FGMTELPGLLAANNLPGPTAVRANRLGTTRAALSEELEDAGVHAAAGRWAEDAVIVEGAAARLRTLPAWGGGRLTVQGEASQLTPALLGLRPGTALLDACAAPGGKACHAATTLDGRGHVVAIDRRTAGARRIQAEAARLGVTVRVAVADARRPAFGGA